jgi:serine O-acetyltransferase
MTLKFKDILKNEILMSDRINILRLLKTLIVNHEKKIIYKYRIAKFLYEIRMKRFANLVNNGIKKKYGVYISLNAEIGLGIKLPHPTSIVIGDRVKIGNNCTIYQNVTIGGKKRDNNTQTQYPIIKGNVIIFSGAVLIGAIIVEENCIIGANSVLNRDTEANTTYVGIPAKKIIRNGDELNGKIKNSKK